MKLFKFAFMAVILTALSTSCTKVAEDKENTETSSSTPGVEVVYFHGKMRCLKCRAIERFAKEAVDSCFAGNDSVHFKVVDITTADGERMADAFNVSNSALLIISKADGKSSYEDLTAFGFKNARKNTPLFKKEVVTIVRKHLNDLQ